MSDRKDKIKNIAIIFLIIMLLLTFFSNTIMNYSLVEVSTQMIVDDKITTKVRGNGTVEASENYAVTIKESRKIEKINVKTDAEVQTGDVLFTLEDAESEELIAKRKELKDAERTYETAVLTAGITVAERNAIEAGKSSSLSEKQNQLAQARANVEAAQETVNTLTKQEAANTTVDTTSEEAAVIKAEQDKIAAEAEVTKKSEQITDADAAVTTAEEKVKTKKTDMNTKKAAYEKLKEEGADSGEIKEAKEAYESAKASYEKAQKAYEDAKTDYNNACNDKVKADQAMVVYEQAVSNAQNALTNKIEAAGSALSAELEQAQKNLETVTAELEEVTTKLTTEIDLSSQYEALVELREEVTEMEGEAVDAEVTSPINGTVTEILYTAGQTVSAEETVLTIQPENKAYLLKFEVTANQAKKIKPDDAVTILNNWYGADITAKVLSVRRDPEDKDVNVVTCELSGDISAGDSYTVSVGEQSANYDLVVPTSCIREDSNGNFILIIESKSTPLGNRYYARRVDVEIITSDDTKSAISGALEGYEYVITTTTKPVEENQQVRLAE